MKLKIIKQTVVVWVACVCLIAARDVEDKLPFLQQELLPESIKDYQTQQKQSFFLQCSPEAGILGKLHHACHVHNSYIDIQTLSHLDYDHSQNKKYLYTAEPPVVYTIDDTELVAHSIGEQHHKQKDKETFKFKTNCSKDMVFEFSRQKMFAFSCEAVYEMKLDASAFQMREIMRYQEHLDVKSAQRFEDLIILVTYSKGVFIYAVNVGLQLVSLGKVEFSSENQTEIVDAYYAKGELVLLDRYNGLQYYKRDKNEFAFVDSLALALDGDVEYLFLEIWKNTTFIAMETETQSFVVELQNFRKKVYLVRYYKGYEQILKIALYNNSLIIHSNSKLDLFPINRDPRTIKQALNGYSYSHDESVLSFQHLTGNSFLLLRGKTASITSWSLINKKIECDFAQTGSYSVMLESPCGPNTENTFWRACSQVSVSMITVYHKDTYIWLLLIIIGAFLTAVMLLIFWRESKVARIVHILLKIKTFSQKKQELQLKDRKEGIDEEKSKSRPDGLGESQEGGKEQQMDPYEAYIKSERDNLH